MPEDLDKTSEWIATCIFILLVAPFVYVALAIENRRTHHGFGFDVALGLTVVVVGTLICLPVRRWVKSRKAVSKKPPEDQTAPPT